MPDIGGGIPTKPVDAEFYGPRSDAPATTHGRRMTPEEALANVPARILDREQRLWDAKQHVEFSKREAGTLESQVYAEVSAHLTDGKKTYSNAEARDAATKSLLARDERAVRLQASLEGAQKRVQALQADVDYLRDVQRNARVLLLARSPMQVFWDDVRDLGA